MDFADGLVASARGVEPCSNVTVRSTRDTHNVNVAGGVVVANLVAAIVEGAIGSALGGCDGVRERHAAES